MHRALTWFLLFENTQFDVLDEPVWQNERESVVQVYSPLWTVSGVWHMFCFVFEAMKRVRTEQIQYAVAQYLKRRQYVDTDGSLKGAKLFQSAEEMAASLTGEHVFTLDERK